MQQTKVTLFFCFIASIFLTHTNSPITHPTKKAHLVDLRTVDNQFVIQVIFASVNAFNSFKEAIYPHYARLFLHQPAAYALHQAQIELSQHNPAWVFFLGDAYRPLRYQWLLWEKAKLLYGENPEPYVSNPLHEAFHCRGTAVDIAIFSLEAHTLIPLPPVEYTARAHQGYYGNDLTKEQILHRDFLKALMEKHGFEAYEAEWWHYNWKGWQDFQKLDIDFHELLS